MSTQYLTRSRTLEVFTFAEFVEHGRQQVIARSGENGLQGENRMPWSFEFFGHPVTHENDSLYLISSPMGGIRFRAGEGQVIVAYDIKDDAITPLRLATIEDIEEEAIQVEETNAFDGIGPSILEGTFEFALNAIKAGLRVARAGWNGKGQWAAMSGTELRPARVPTEGLWSPHSRAEAERQGGTVEVLPALILRNAQGQIVMGWLPSTGDLLATDWMLYADPA